MTARPSSPDTVPEPLPDLATEPTAIGAQSLVPGVAPITPRDRLAWRAAAPMEPKKPQRPCDHGLFDTNARNQLDMFQQDLGTAKPCRDADANETLPEEQTP